MKPYHFMIALAACGWAACQPAEKDSDIATETATDADHKAHIHLDASTLAELELDTCRAIWTTLYDSIGLRGAVQAPPQSIYDIATPYGGRVTEMNFYEGAEVAKGQVLARISHVEYIALQEDYLSLRAKDRELKMALDRQKSLQEKESTSEKAYQSALAAYELNKASLQGTEARLKLSYIDPQVLSQEGIQAEVALRAPVDGFITEAFGHIGKQLSPEAPVYQLIDRSHLHVELAAQQDKAAQIEVGQRVSFSFGDGRTIHGGAVFLVSKHVDTDMRTVNVHVHPDEGVTGLLPGMFVQATVYTSAQKKWVLPAGSAANHAGKWYGIKQEGDLWMLSEFDRQQVLSDGRVQLDSTDTAPYICKRLERALALVLEDEEGGRSHGH